MSKIKQLPNFFLVGPPKCATTTIAFQVARHPDVFVSNPKEPNYFMYKGGNPYGWESSGNDNGDWYESLFEGAGNAVAVGEASTHYFIAEHVAREIREFNPDARIIVVLRNPIHRAFSMYRYWHRNQREKPSVIDFLDSFSGEKLCKASQVSAVFRIGYLKDAGLYMKHLRRYLDQFDRQRIAITFYCDLVKDSCSYFEKLFTFLGVDPAKWTPNDFVLNETKEPMFRNVHHFMWNPMQSGLGRTLKNSALQEPLKILRNTFTRLNCSNISALKLPEEAYNMVFEYYAADVLELEELVGQNLSGWRDGSML